MRVTHYIALMSAVFISFIAGQPSSPPDGPIQQKPLLDINNGHTQNRKPLYPFSLREHAPDAEICNAGSKQYTGTVSVSDEKKLFFWLFESRNDPQNSPVTVWLNGGPGGSSLMGLFLEIGPCGLNKHNNGTAFEKYSWTEFTNLLIIDQPASVGFSTVRGGNLNGPDNLAEAATDFHRLLAAFYTDIFPAYSANPLHIAGESFGGKYVPGFVHHILTTQSSQHTLPLPVPITSIILVDAVIEALVSGPLALYDHFCRTDASTGTPLNKHPFNATACDALERDAPECERLTTLCRDTYDPHVCETAYTVCLATLGKWFDGDVYEGGRNPYDDRRMCGPNPPICEGFDDTGGYTAFVNQSWVKRELGFGEGYVFSGINEDLNRRWEEGKEMFLPNTRALGYILDKTEVRVLVLNGNNDVIVATEGQKRVYDRLGWRRQVSFRGREWRYWLWPEGEERKLRIGGQWKGTDDGEVKDKLAFFTIDEAGHASPGDQREAITWLVGCWTGTRKGDERCPV